MNKCLDLYVTYTPVPIFTFRVNLQLRLTIGHIPSLRHTFDPWSKFDSLSQAT